MNIPTGQTGLFPDNSLSCGTNICYANGFALWCICGDSFSTISADVAQAKRGWHNYQTYGDRYPIFAGAPR